jgi:signal transduction histidine kinase
VHAPGATERTVIISANSRGLKIVVADNGVGFRMSSVHKTSLGVKWVIFRRLESLGVKARLDSSPGKGTTWIFEWYP